MDPVVLGCIQGQPRTSQERPIPTSTWSQVLGHPRTTENNRGHSRNVPPPLPLWSQVSVVPGCIQGQPRTSQERPTPTTTMVPVPVVPGCIQGQPRASQERHTPTSTGPRSKLSQSVSRDNRGHPRNPHYHYGPSCPRMYPGTTEDIPGTSHPH